ncbi:hypothetical protein Amet_3810 [Alkaliphilus metalliredigens QYMF]|uniref:Uncharacterized protein n=1 Tax=Alkaliphilus metalliredigens (strain QYMF) TaxID=293826 RepID=A6TUR0_ALKMQ|nr:hypothetical protein Amet_3810 [Alkaliphilus metalliredigens QYMF]
MMEMKMIINIDLKLGVSLGVIMRKVKSVYDYICPIIILIIASLHRGLIKTLRFRHHTAKVGNDF